MQVLYKICVFQIFSPSLWLVFSFKCFHLTRFYLSVFGRADVFGLMKSNLTIFLSWIVLYLKSHRQTRGHLDFLLCFIVLHFTFRSVIHFELTAVNCIKSVCIFFHVDVPLFQHQPFVEKTALSPFDRLSPLSKINWLCLCGSISGLSVLFH